MILDKPLATARITIRDPGRPNMLGTFDRPAAYARKIRAKTVGTYQLRASCTKCHIAAGSTVPSFLLHLSLL